MTEQCPNCSVEFVEQCDLAYFCETCGWLKNVDGQWHPCPEPPKVIEPKPVEPINVPVPLEPVRTEPAKPPILPSDSDRLDSNVHSYLGGLVTVTETEDDEDAQDQVD